MNRTLHATLLGGLLALALPAVPARGSTVDGSCLEPWELPNFQPVSPTYGERVPSAAYRTRTTVVMLLSSG